MNKHYQLTIERGISITSAHPYSIYVKCHSEDENFTKRLYNLYKHRSVYIEKRPAIFNVFGKANYNIWFSGTRIPLGNQAEIKALAFLFLENGEIEFNFKEEKHMALAEPVIFDFFEKMIKQEFQAYQDLLKLKSQYEGIYKSKAVTYDII